MDVAASGNGECVNAVLRAVEALGHAASQAASEVAAGAAGGAAAHGQGYVHHHHHHLIHAHPGYPMGTVTGFPINVMGGGGGAGGFDDMQMGLEGVSRALDGMFARMGGGAVSGGAAGVDPEDGLGVEAADVNSMVAMLAAQAGEDDVGEESADDGADEGVDGEEDEELSGDEEGDGLDGGGQVDEEIPEDEA
eukprot:TRINITY_DN1948_c0_g1_i2.p5 TRINITY_DN1948_c0_g1~~TRINITY_DN1948_c0_g1_i2.p5  ORF type:complete len:193 (+),score=81.25 TRINITY_DN1948_c0_g1_i2:497-1075(+)